MNIKKFIPKTKICTSCERVFLQPKNQRGKTWSNRKYCSHSCMPAWNKGKYVILNRKFFDDNPTIRGKGSRLSWNWPRGEKNHKWIKDRTKLCRISKQGERRTSAYFNWRQQVWLRDNYKCKINNQDCKGRLEAHHILGFTEHPELRYDINNGITLCHAHHPRKRAEEAKLSPFFQNMVAEMK